LEVAETFAALGVEPGAPVAFIGTGPLPGIPELQEAVLQAFAQSGARFVIADRVPQSADTRSWNHVSGPVFFYRALEPAAADHNHD
jgi:hypothetical protein